MENATPARRTLYAGLFLVTLATLTYEILLTRIFSVTMMYHFAFMAVSVAMFGMTTGALVVYLRPGYFSPNTTRSRLALSALLFSLSMVFSFLTHLCIPFTTQQPSLVSLFALAVNYVLIAIPFGFSGICVCLALTRFPRQVSRLYAADLIGAALGCILVIFLLRWTDGPTAVIAVAALAGLGAVCFAAELPSDRLRRVALVCTILLGALAVGNTGLVRKQASPLRLMWVKGEREPPPLYEKWNSFSRITVLGDPDVWRAPTGWGLSTQYPPDRKVRQLSIMIDSTAETLMTAPDPEGHFLDYLKYDVTNLAHYVRPNARVLVVGVGGGRDILSALAFHQPSVLGVEINQDLLQTLNGPYGAFSGHLDRLPNVTFVNDEARSYIARSADRFDIIQVSLIDTFAATAAGAFVLTENGLYTVEAWKLFLSRLSPNGVLSFSRWYFADRPGEMYRITALATKALQEMGVSDPRRHILIVANTTRPAAAGSRDGVGTILVSKQPFSPQDLDTISQVVARMRFELVLSPRQAHDDTFATLASGNDLAGFTARYPLYIAPPTDDRPFFFQMLRLRDIAQPQLAQQGMVSFNMKAVLVLGTLLIVVVLLTLLCILVPLLLTTRAELLQGSLPLGLFFAAIGVGFMLIEIAQMQRLMIFLGHPTYSLSVVLFSLLLSSGLGSALTQPIPTARLFRTGLPVLALLLFALLALGLLTPVVIRSFESATTPIRILAAVLLLFPLGVGMGTAFPLGMKAAARQYEALTPWFWGINGATSVCASVLAVVISLSAGISTTYWTGAACYLLALGTFARINEKPSLK